MVVTYFASLQLVARSKNLVSMFQHTMRWALKKDSDLFENIRRVWKRKPDKKEKETTKHQSIDHFDRLGLESLSYWVTGQESGG